MVEWLPRSAWGAREPNGGRTPLVRGRVKGAVIHWPGMANPISSQAAVASALRGWQRYHMDVRGWSDIAYQAAVDQAGRKWTLRGLNIQSGANGNQELNQEYGALLLILAPGEALTNAMKATTREVVAEFRGMFPGAVLIRPHSAVRPGGTDCPGDRARAAISAGVLTPGGTTPGDDVTPEQMKELKDHITTEARRYAVANNNYTRQVLATSTKAILAKIDGVDEATAAAVAAELDDEFAALSAQIVADA